MATPTIYRSSDASAPVISGTASALRLALNAILVDGYGSQPAAGWTKEFENAGSHLVVYRPGAGQRRYLYLDDSPAQLSAFRGYGSMSSISAGVEMFPAVSSASPNLRKSVTANSTARPWICLATSSTFYIIIFGNQAALGSFDGGDAHFAFGDLVESPLIGHDYLTFIIGGSDVSTTSTTATVSRQAFNFNNTNTVVAPNSSLCGSFTQLPLPTQMLSLSNNHWGEVESGGAGFPSYPDPSTGKLLISQFLAMHGHGGQTNIIAGKMPGLWCVCHPASNFTNLDTFSGSGDLAGRTFLIVRTGVGCIVFETGGNW
jgi:hypothetical protein